MVATSPSDFFFLIPSLAGSRGMRSVVEQLRFPLSDVGQLRWQPPAAAGSRTSARVTGLFPGEHLLSTLGLLWFDFITLRFISPTCL